MSVFKVQDGNIVALGENGAPRFSEKRAGEPLTPIEYAEALQKSAPHLFKSDVGAGSPGSAGKGSNAGPTKIVESLGDNIEAIAKGDATVPVPWDSGE